MIALVGSTGFVGGNIAAGGPVDLLFHSTNIEEAFGTKPDILIYAGLRAEKFLAEKFPDADMDSILEAEENIRKIAPKQLVLISTIDVYEDSFRKTEETEAAGNGAYGRHRAMLEDWVKENVPDHLIIRLPGLFGKGIKKNFIYDYIHYLPALLNSGKFAELSEQDERLKNYYHLNEKGFYQLADCSGEEKALLRNIFTTLGFSALNFTDSRGQFQYYNLEHLYGDIFKALDNNIKMLNIAAEPVTIGEIYSFLRDGTFVNEISEKPPCYDVRTGYYRELDGFCAPDGIGGYLYTKQQVLTEIKEFADKEMQL